MTVEQATYIDDLDVDLPNGVLDPLYEGDNHLRLIKQTIKNTFPNITNRITVTQDNLNSLSGITGNVQARLVAVETSSGGGTAATFPAGTRLMFQQSVAPAGWTKDTAQNNKAMRVVSGNVTTGGTVDFTTAFSLQPTSSTVLTVAQIPAHTHGGSTEEILYRVDPPRQFPLTGAEADVYRPSSLNPPPYNAIWQSATIASASTGGGSGHSHTVDMRVQYVDTIIATKD